MELDFLVKNSDKGDIVTIIFPGLDIYGLAKIELE
jgi:hypothetical protein